MSTVDAQAQGGWAGFPTVTIIRPGDRVSVRRHLQRFAQAGVPLPRLEPWAGVDTAPQVLFQTSEGPMQEAKSLGLSTTDHGVHGVHTIIYAINRQQARQQVDSVHSCCWVESEFDTGCLHGVPRCLPAFRTAVCTNLLPHAKSHSVWKSRSNRSESRCSARTSLATSLTRGPHQW